MVQALAFAEIFLGLILADAGYKGVSIPQVVKGEAGKGTTPLPLGATATASSTGSTPGETLPGSTLAPTPAEAAKNRAFGPSPEPGFSGGEMGSPTQLFGERESHASGTNRVFGPQPINSPNSLFGTAGAAP